MALDDLTDVTSQPSAEVSEPAGGDFSWSTEADTDVGAAGGAEDPVLELDGKSYKASELREYMKGGMREKDYRQKTMQLADEKKQLSELRQAAEAWQTLQDYPELMQHLGQRIAEMLQGGQAQPGPQAAPRGPADAPQVPGGPDEQPWNSDIQKLRQQMAGVIGTYDQRLQEYNKWAWDNYYAQRESHAKGHIESLRQKYPYLYPDEVVAAFRNNQEADLETLAKLSSEHWQNFYREREKANLDKRKQNATARVDGAAAKGGAPATQVKQPKSYEDAQESAMERLGKLSGKLWGK